MRRANQKRMKGELTRGNLKPSSTDFMHLKCPRLSCKTRSPSRATRSSMNLRSRMSATLGMLRIMDTHCSTRELPPGNNTAAAFGQTHDRLEGTPSTAGPDGPAFPRRRGPRPYSSFSESANVPPRPFPSCWSRCPSRDRGAVGGHAGADGGAFGASAPRLAAGLGASL